MEVQIRRLWLYRVVMALTTVLVLCIGILVGLMYIDERK